MIHILIKKKNFHVLQCLLLWFIDNRQQNLKNFNETDRVNPVFTLRGDLRRRYQKK